MNKTYADSTLKGMTKENLIGLIRCLEHNVEAVEERNQRQYEMLIKNDRYAWHDLTKNPNDLPDEDGRCFCFVISKKSGLGWYVSGEYWHKQWCIDLDGLGNKVIAWKRIEPLRSN